MKLCLVSSVAFAVTLNVLFEPTSESSSPAPVPPPDYCNINDMQKYCPPCSRACGVNKCGCTCPITKEPILPRSSNPPRLAYCSNCPICFQLKEKCANPLPLCTADTIRDCIAL